jgi:hypothetical protein
MNDGPAGPGKVNTNLLSPVKYEERQRVLSAVISAGSHINSFPWFFCRSEDENNVI